MRLLILTHWLSNRGGGVPVVAAAHARTLAGMDGLEVHVTGLLCDPAGLADQDWGGAAVHPVVPREARLIGYAPGTDRVIARIAPDVVHLHGLWTYASIAAGRWRRRTPAGRLFISPHGMLEPWALRNSGWKKRLAGAAFQKRTCALADCLHALTPAETEEIRAYCGPKPVAEIPNGVILPESEPSPGPAAPRRAEGRPRTLLCLGRIHPKKNIGYLLDLWASSGAGARGWRLQVAGWDQDGTQARLQAQAQRLGIAGSVVFSGPLFGADKEAAFRAADAFVLPSLGEGLPMVVLEAWSHGLPVLMTEACNLPAGFEADAARRLHADDPDAGRRDLAGFLALAPADLAGIGARGRSLAERSFLWKGIARELKDAYGWSRGDRPAPDCIRD